METLQLDMSLVPKDICNNPKEGKQFFDALATAIVTTPDAESQDVLRMFFRSQYQTLTQRWTYLNDRAYPILDQQLSSPSRVDKVFMYTALHVLEQVLKEGYIDHTDYYLWLCMFLCNGRPQRPKNCRVIQALEDYLIGYKLRGSHAEENRSDNTNSRKTLALIMLYMLKDPNIQDDVWVEETYNTISYTVMLIVLVNAVRGNHHSELETLCVPYISQRQQDLRENRHVEVYETKPGDDPDSRSSSAGPWPIRSRVSRTTPAAAARSIGARIFDGLKALVHPR